MNFITIKRPLFRAVVFCYAFFAVEFLGSLGIGPLSFRNIVLILIIMYLFICRSKRVVVNYNVAKTLFCYYVFVAIIGLCSDLYEGEGFTLVFARMVPSAIFFYFTIKFIDNRATLNLVLLLLTCWVLLDGVATILQGFNHPIGWVIAALTQTAETVDNNKEFIERLGSSIGESSASGIMGSVVANGYFLASYGLLFCIPLLKQKSFSTIYAFSLLLVTIMALFYNQQRSAFYLFLVCSAVFLYYCIHSLRSFKIGFLFILILAIIVIPRMDILTDMDFGRLSEVSRQEASDRNNDTEEFFFEYIWQGNNIILGNQTKWEKAHGGFTPHNMFAETFLQGGIIGLFIFLIFLIKLLRDIYVTFKKKQVTSIILSGVILSIILVSLTHSSGFHTGFSFATTGLALFLLSRDLLYESISIY